MTVLIAIPYFGVSAELVDKAARHAVAQSHPDTVVLIAGDGQKPPVTFRHERLVVGTFPTNLGAPATNQGMLMGSPFEWYAPVDADDWIQPDHIARLMALRSEAAGSRHVLYHYGPKIVRHSSRHTWVWFGSFKTALLREIGGMGPQEWCGQDSVVISVLMGTSRISYTDRPTYHKVLRADSLTHDPRTKQGSPLREAMKLRNRAVLRHCAALGWKREAVRAYRESLIPVSLRGQLDDRAALVARWLS